MVLEKSKQLRARGNVVLGTDPKFEKKVTALEGLVHERRKKLKEISGLS